MCSCSFARTPLHPEHKLERVGTAEPGYSEAMNARVLWILAVIIAVVGVIQLLQGQIIFGIILLVVAAAVGPGGWSVIGSRRT